MGCSVHAVCGINRGYTAWANTAASFPYHFKKIEKNILRPISTFTRVTQSNIGPCLVLRKTRFLRP